MHTATSPAFIDGNYSSDYYSTWAESRSVTRGIATKSQCKQVLKPYVILPFHIDFWLQACRAFPTPFFVCVEIFASLSRAITIASISALLFFVLYFCSSSKAASSVVSLLSFLSGRWNSVSMRIYVVNIYYFEMGILFIGTILTGLVILISLQCYRKAKGIFAISANRINGKATHPVD